METSKKHLRRVRAQNIRAFTQRGHSGLASLAQFMGVPDESGNILMEIGSSSIDDPLGHIAKLKMAMGLQTSKLEAAWAFMGDPSASLYVGFQPGFRPSRTHPQLWLRRLVQAMPSMQRETLHFVDKIFTGMILLHKRVKTQSLVTILYPEPYLSEMKIPDSPPLFPLRERTLQ